MVGLGRELQVTKAQPAKRQPMTNTTRFVRVLVGIELNAIESTE